MNWREERTIVIRKKCLIFKGSNSERQTSVVYTTCWYSKVKQNVQFLEISQSVYKDTVLLNYDCLI